MLTLYKYKYWSRTLSFIIKSSSTDKKKKTLKNVISDLLIEAHGSSYMLDPGNLDPSLSEKPELHS